MQCSVRSPESHPASIPDRGAGRSRRRCRYTRLDERPDSIGRQRTVRRARASRRRACTCGAGGTPEGARDRGAPNRGRSSFGAARAHRRCVRAGLRNHAGLPRPGRGQRNGQVRACGPQDRRHARLHRHPGVLHASRRGQPRRSGHGHRRRRRAGAVLLRQYRRTAGDRAARQAPGRRADRHDRSRRFPAGRAGRRPSRRGGGPRSLPAQSRPHRQHDRVAGAGRRAGGGTARGARLQPRRLRLVASRAARWAAACSPMSAT
jgi:hypothetical protein